MNLTDKRDTDISDIDKKTVFNLKKSWLTPGNVCICPNTNPMYQYPKVFRSLDCVFPMYCDT